MKKMANNEADYQQAKALLKSLKSGGTLFQQGAINDSDTYSVYDHMVSLIKYLIEKNPLKGYDEFEQISLLIKKEMAFISSKEFYDVKEYDERSEKRPPDLKSIIYESSKKELGLFIHPEHKWHENPVLDKTERISEFNKNLEPNTYDNHTQNYGQLSLCESVPVGLTRTEILRVWLSLRSLAVKLPQQGRLKFWGKFNTLTGSYYIAERNSLGGPGDDEIEGPWDEDSIVEEEENTSDKVPTKNEIPKEEPGTGCNSWDYYITKQLSNNDWKRLPQVTPEQIISSRSMRLFLTGNLNEPLKKEFAFKGVEANYVRALISRIGHGSFISPKGYFAGEEEEQEINDGGMDPNDLLILNSWVHVRPMILDKGRTIWSSADRFRANRERDEGSNDYEDEEDYEEFEEDTTREGPILYKNITEDLSVQIRNPADETFPAWRLSCSSKLLPKGDVITVNKSNNWDDTYALVKKSDLVNIYNGWGLKRTDKDFHYKVTNEISAPYDLDPRNAYRVKEAVDPTPLEEAEFAARNKTPSEISEASGEDSGDGEDDDEDAGADDDEEDVED